MNRGSARIHGSVRYVRQFGKPKESRLSPTAFRRVHLRFVARPSGSVFSCFSGSVFSCSSGSVFASYNVLLLATPGFVRLGGVRLPVFGIFAATGLIAALWLSQRSALRVGIDPDRLWDAGFAAAVAAFLASRLLLIATDPHAFLRYPLLILALPSLTWTGLLLTAVFTWLWLRWRRLPVRVVMDAWAAPACVLAAALEWGHWVTVTEPGMPTRMPWGHVMRGEAALGPTEPVQLFAITAALALGVWMWWLLPRRRFAGQAAGWAMMVGGLLTFLLDFLRQPEAVLGTLPLDSGQIAALAAISAGGFLLLSPQTAQRMPQPAQETANAE